MLERFLSEAEQAALVTVELPSLTGLRETVESALTERGFACFAFRVRGREQDKGRFVSELLRFLHRADGLPLPGGGEKPGSSGEQCRLLLDDTPSRDCFVILDDAHLLVWPEGLSGLLEQLMLQCDRRLHVVLLAPCPISFIAEADMLPQSMIRFAARDFLLEWETADECLQHAYPELLGTSRRRVFELCGGWVSAMDAVMERISDGSMELNRCTAWGLAGYLPELCALLEEWTKRTWPVETMTCMEKVCAAARLPEELALRLADGEAEPLRLLSADRFLIRCTNVFHPVYTLNGVLQSWLYHRTERARGRGFLQERHRVAAQYGREAEDWQMVFSHQLRRGYADEAALTLRYLSFSELDAALLEEYLQLVRKLPGASISKLPWVQLGCAIAMKYRYPNFAFQYLDHAIETFRAMGDWEGVVLSCCQKISMGFFSAEQKVTAVEFLRILDEETLTKQTLEPVMDGYRKTFTAYAMIQQGTDYARAIELLEEAAETAILKENNNLRLWVCFVMILTYKDCQYTDGIQTILNEALELAEAEDVQKPLKMCLYQTVAFLCYVEAGQYGEACACCERAARIANEIEAYGYTVYINMVYAYALDCLKRFEKAERVILDTEKISRTILNIRNEYLWSYYLIGQSYHYFLKGDQALALDTAEKAVFYARHSGRISYIIRSYLVLGNILADKEQYERAETIAKECLHLCQPQKYQFYRISAQFLLAQLYRRQGQTALFEVCFGKLAAESKALGIFHYNFAKPEVICQVLKDYKGCEKDRNFLLQLKACNETGGSPAKSQYFDLLPQKPVQIKIFGCLSVETGGRTLEPCASGKAMQMLRVLALHPGPVSVHKLLEAFWPDWEEKSAMNNFYFTLHQLRAYLERKEAVTYKRGLCSFNHDVVSVDARIFARLIRTAQDYVSSGNLTAAESYYEQASFLCHGPVLDGEDLPNEALIQREALERDIFHALRDYGVICMKRNHLDQAERILSKAAQSVFSDERTYRFLMKTQYFSGDKNGALTTYERLRAQLREELGVDPHRLTEELADQIRHNQDLSNYPE